MPNYHTKYPFINPPIKLVNPLRKAYHLEDNPLEQGEGFNGELKVSMMFGHKIHRESKAHVGTCENL